MIYVLIALAICCINFIWWTHLVRISKAELEKAEYEYEATQTVKAHLRLCGYEAKLHRQQMWHGFWGISAFICALVWSCMYYE